MPLCTLAGLPCAGKTLVAEALVADLRARGESAELVNEESLGLDKNASYRDFAAEKVTRASLKAAVERAISTSTVVVLDSLNYIKGFRYELHCIARATQTQHCVLWVSTAAEQCLEWNAGRGTPLAADTMEGLLGRFEAPNEKQRWDKPLFRVDPAAGEPLEPLFEGIADALLRGVAPRAGLATASLAEPDAPFLSRLDAHTQAIVGRLVEALPDAVPGDAVLVPHTDVRVVMARTTSLPELRRVRRTFIRMATAAPERYGAVADNFASYVSTQLSQ